MTPPPLQDEGGGVRKTIVARMAQNDLKCLFRPRFPFLSTSAPPPILSNTKKGIFYNEVLLKDILSLTLTIGCKNEKQPPGPIELDLEVGNLVEI